VNVVNDHQKKLKIIDKLLVFSILYFLISTIVPLANAVINAKIDVEEINSNGTLSLGIQDQGKS